MHIEQEAVSNAVENGFEGAQTVTNNKYYAKETSDT